MRSDKGIACIQTSTKEQEHWTFNLRPLSFIFRNTKKCVLPCTPLAVAGNSAGFESCAWFGSTARESLLTMGRRSPANLGMRCVLQSISVHSIQCAGGYIMSHHASFWEQSHCLVGTSIGCWGWRSLMEKPRLRPWST